MLKTAARRADDLARLVPDADPGKATTRAEISRLGHACGCATGAAFLIGATVLVAAYAALSGERGARFVLLGVLFVLTASMVGKLTGVLVAVARLAAIRRRLSRHVVRAGSGTHTTVGGA
jgi:VIT1/CCC1 family predicted Fe2+/Mn2+ transporter